MTGDAKGLGDCARGAELARMPLSVTDAEGKQLEAIAPSHRGGRIRVESAAQQDDGARSSARHTPRVSGDQMYLCAWSCSRTGRRSARIHSARTRASSTPCTGENKTAATCVGKRLRATTSRANS